MEELRTEAQCLREMLRFMQDRAQTMSDFVTSLKIQDQQLTSMNESFSRERQQLTVTNELLLTNVMNLEQQVGCQRNEVDYVKSQRILKRFESNIQFASRIHEAQHK